MKIAKNLVVVICLALLNFACLQQTSSQTAKSENEVKSAQEKASDKITSSPSPTPKSPEKDTAKPTEKDDSKLTAEVLQTEISKNLGSFLVVKNYKPNFLKGDFNGDGFTDLVVVAGIEDRNNPNQLGDIFEGAKFISVQISLQNLNNEGVLLAAPKQNSMTLDKKKAQLKAESKLGLLILFGGKDDWKTELAKENYDKKFLIFDALFEPNFEDEKNAPEMLSLVKKGDECLPKVAKGEAIFSGDRESGGKVIYFNGKMFEWIQCGE